MNGSDTNGISQGTAPAENPLGTVPVGSLLLQYAIPSIISTLIASLYNMVDQMFIGQRTGFWAMRPQRLPIR